VGVEILSEITRLRVSIDRAAMATESALADHQGASEYDGPGSPRAEWKELCRQLAALRDRLAVAEYAHEDPAALRAEFATLPFFAKTLQADADNWRSMLEGRAKELERQRAAARFEQERLAGEREMLVRRRGALQLRIAQTAARMAQRHGGECRRTLPVITLGESLSVCSVTVSCPRKALRVAKQWLVTLNDSRDDVVVRRE